MTEDGSNQLLDGEIIGQLVFLSEDDPAFIPDLLSVLEKEMSIFQVSAGRLIDEGNHAELERLLHKLSGAAANLGANELQLRMRRLQTERGGMSQVEFKIEVEGLRLLAEASLAELRVIFPKP